MLLGALSKGLGLLRCVDAGQSDLVLCLTGVQHGDRVAIADAHHFASEYLAKSGVQPEGQEQREANFIRLRSRGHYKKRPQHDVPSKNRDCSLRPAPQQRFDATRVLHGAGAKRLRHTSDPFSRVHSDCTDMDSA